MPGTTDVQRVNDFGPLGCLVLFGVVAAMLAGCNITVQTPSINAPAPAVEAPSVPEQLSRGHPDLTPEDWRRALGALAIAVEPQGSPNRVRWNNPETQHRGEFKAAGLPTVADDQICRAFTASVTTDHGSSMFKGTACQLFGDDWEIREIGR